MILKHFSLMSGDPRSSLKKIFFYPKISEQTCDEFNIFPLQKRYLGFYHIECY